jgi:hypothetical protein
MRRCKWECGTASSRAGGEKTPRAGSDIPGRARRHGWRRRPSGSAAKAATSQANPSMPCRVHAPTPLCLACQPPPPPADPIRPPHGFPRRVKSWPSTCAHSPTAPVPRTHTPAALGSTDGATPTGASGTRHCPPKPPPASAARQRGEAPTPPKITRRPHKSLPPSHLLPSP